MKSKKQHIITSFQKSQFDTFIKNAFNDADTIRIVLSEKIPNPSYLEQTKWAYLKNSISSLEEIDGDGANYGNTVSRLTLKKDSFTLKYFHEINSWDDFAEEDETTELRMELVEFLLNKKVFAWIVSDYADYCNHYGWYDYWKSEKF